MNRIQEYIIEQLSKTPIFEMALDRADYLRLVINTSGQIVENWCLIRYCTLYDKNNANKTHWKTELDAACYKLFKTHTKHDKKRLLETGFIKELELNDENTLQKYTVRKFKIEQIPNTTLPVIYKDFINALPHLIYLISGNDYNELYRYIDEDI